MLEFVVNLKLKIEVGRTCRLVVDNILTKNQNDFKI